MRTSHDLDQVVTALGRPADFPERPRLESAPALAALRRAGTAHVYADTADVEELGALLDAGNDHILAEIDGNTANQPLVGKVIERTLDAEGVDVRHWAREIRGRESGLDSDGLLALLYAIACGRIGNAIVHRFASGRPWEVSLQLHMSLVHHPGLARRVGRLLRDMVPGAIVKVPFAPHAPGTLLVARDLEREGIPVNFTSTFSARQAVLAALLTDATRTNIFMGRLDAGLRAERLGVHVDLEAQRALLELRRSHGVKTRLIVASLHDWRSIVETAGCDVYTAPCGVLQKLLQQEEVAPEAIRSQLETSYADRLGIDAGVRQRLGDERIARLYRVEPELVEFLSELRRSAGYEKLDDGEALVRRFEAAGFGDVFHAPDEAAWRELRKGKLPDLDGTLVDRLALDTYYALLADADFDAHQEKIDAAIARRLD